MRNTTYEASDVQARAHAQWHGILAHLGVPEARLTNKHGPCPSCGGKDRFRFDDQGSGHWYCNVCGGPDYDGGGGDGLSLLMRVNGWTYPDAIQQVGDYLGLGTGTSTVVPLRPPRKAPETTR